MWNSSNSRLPWWKWYAPFVSVEDLHPIPSVEIILLNEQVKLMHQVQFRASNTPVIPFVMVQYEPNVGQSPSRVAQAKQGGRDTQVAVLLRGAHDGGGHWQY